MELGVRSLRCTQSWVRIQRYHLPLCDHESLNHFEPGILGKVKSFPRRVHICDPAIRRWRWEEHESETNLGYSKTLALKKTKQNKRAPHAWNGERAL
jgi:hypothetical protein